MAFWTTATEPKRNYRFKVILGEFDDGAIWYAKSAGKPGFTVNEGTHKYLGHTFHFPGSITWSNVSVTLVDPVEPDAGNVLFRILRNAGYKLPQRPGSGAGPEFFETLGKDKMAAAIGTVTIQQLDSSGNVLETYTLNNPMIANVSFSDLSYDDEELTNITVEFAYDWAEITTGLGAAANTYFSPSTSEPS
mgnify:FL=1